jgi:CheY-like chemotaxis protein
MPNITKGRTEVTVRIDRQAAAEIAYILSAVLSDLQAQDKDGTQAIERVRNATTTIANAVAPTKGGCNDEQ